MTQTKAELLETKHQGDIRLGDANSSHYVGFKAPATVSSSLVWTLPAADGTANYLLKTDGSGNLAWTADNSGVSLSGSTNNTIATVTGANALQGEANLTFNGSVLGVGTNGSITTGSNFSLNGNALTVTGTAGTVIEGKRAGSATIQATNTTNSTDLQLRADATGGLVRTASNNPLVFGTNQTERMRILSNGKIGIGTTAPAKLLTVDAASGDGELQVSGSTGGRINLKDTGSGEEFLIACAGDAHIQSLTGGKSLVFKTTPTGGSVTEVLRIDSSGKVGIGENSPSYQLDVKGDTGATFSAGSNSSAGLITISGRNSGGSGSALSRLKSYPDGSSNQSHFAIETRNSSASMVEAMRITSTQKVLIGTTTEGSPAADNLTIADSGDCGLTIRAGTSSSGQIYFSDATSGDDEYDGAIEWSHSTQVMKFYADSGERFRIASSGQIGIGGANYGTSGQVLTSGGSSSAPSWADAAGGGATPTVKTANYTAASGDMVVVNGTGLTITLPSSPSTGDSVAIRILGDRYATVARNSSNIESSATNYYVDIFDGYATFTYSDSTRGWLIGG